MISYISEYEYCIKVEPINGVSLKDLDFSVTTYTYANKFVTFRKSDTDFVKQVDKDTYKVTIDLENAEKIGRGKIMARLTLHIPNKDFKDGFQTVVIDKISTGWDF